MNAAQTAVPATKRRKSAHGLDCYARAAQWVQPRCTTSVSDSEIIAALHGLAHAVAVASADFVGEGLFPGSDLEVSLSRDLDADEADRTLPPYPEKVEMAAIRAIGEAITKEMQTTGKELLTLNAKGIGEIVVFPPALRETVLLGTNTTLLMNV